MRFIKLLSLLLTVILMLMIVTACTSDYRDAYIYIDFDSTPTCLDPQLAYTDEELTVVRSIFDTLLRYDDSGNGNIWPSGAESFEKSGNTYTFKLDKNAKWTDGTPVTSADYLFAFKRAVDPETKAPFANSLFSIKGAEAINKGEAEMSELGVTAPDDYTLKIELQRDDPEFTEVLTTAITMPCNEKYFNNCKGKYGLTIETTPSNGSYYVRKWTTDVKFLIRLAKNLDYSGKYQANSMRVYFTCSDDEAFSMLEHDNTDLVFVSTEEYDTIKDGGFKTVKIVDTCYSLFISNSVDADIRKALLSTVTYDSFEDSLAQTQSVADIIYPDIIRVDSAPAARDFIKYDPKTAADLYSSKILSGYSMDGVSIKHPNDDISRQVAKDIAAHWQQKLSCFINIEEASIGSIAASYYGNYYDIIILPFSAPTGTVTAYHSKLGFDSYSTAEVSEALYKNYNCYPLFYSTANIGVGHKIQNIDSAVHGSVLDISMLIKFQN